MIGMCRPPTPDEWRLAQVWCSALMIVEVAFGVFDDPNWREPPGGDYVADVGSVIVANLGRVSGNCRDCNIRRHLRSKGAGKKCSIDLDVTKMHLSIEVKIGRIPDPPSPPGPGRSYGAAYTTGSLRVTHQPTQAPS